VGAFACNRTIGWGERPLPPGQPWVTQHSAEELLTLYSEFGPDAKILLSCLPRPSAWSIHAVSPFLESFVRGRVALVGDAAHAMLPHLGAGAGQGIEDVFALAKLLSNPQTRRDNVEQVLRAYDAIRRPHAQIVSEKSNLAGDIYEGYGPSGFTKEGLAVDLRDLWLNHWEKIWKHDLSADVEAAVSQLVQDRVFQ
jgi:salicylate hydroxylase